MERKPPRSAKTFKGLGGILPSADYMGRLEAEEIVRREEELRRLLEPPVSLPSVKPLKKPITGPRHKLSVDERRARRVRNRQKARRARERLTGASTGCSTWIKQARTKRREEKESGGA